MDPDANLREQREIIAGMLADDSEHIDTGDAVRLAELARALDEWISNGGFLPAAWRSSNPHLDRMYVLRVWNGAVYLRLPAELQRPSLPDASRCQCDHCRTHPDQPCNWDTLAIELKPGKQPWTVHAPAWKPSDKPTEKP